MVLQSHSRSFQSPLDGSGGPSPPLSARPSRQPLGADPPLSPRAIGKRREEPLPLPFQPAPQTSRLAFFFFFSLFCFYGCFPFAPFFSYYPFCLFCFFYFPFFSFFFFFCFIFFYFPFSFFPFSFFPFSFFFCFFCFCFIHFPFSPLHRPFSLCWTRLLPPVSARPSPPRPR